MSFLITNIKLFLNTTIAIFQQSEQSGLDKVIDNKVKPIADFVESIIFYEVPLPGGYGMPLILLTLVGGALFFSLRFSFVNIRKFGLAINIVRGKYDGIEKARKKDKTSGEVSHFQALSAAVSGTVGLGNIAGVALAIAVGGPGATFWMILCGLLGMSSKFIECTLGVKYRDVGPDGKTYGGPMYYLSKGLKEVGLKRLGKFLAIAFSTICIGASFAGGNAAQSNQAAAQIATVFGVDSGSGGTIIGLILALIVGSVIIGGIKRIASVTEILVPFMAGIYILACLIVIGFHFSYIDEALSLIIKGAFTPEAGLGGVLGVLIMGFRRAAFSNEAGVGSSPIAHSAVKTKYPVSEGLVAMLEPFIDTVIICTMTALVIIFYNSSGIFAYGDPTPTINGATVGGAGLTSLAFANVIPWFPYILTLAICLFAISTMISWSYYGLQSWMFVFGKSKSSELSFKIVFLFCTVIGAAANMKAVWALADSMTLGIGYPNMIGLIILYPKVQKEFKRYLSAIKKHKTKKQES